VLVVDPLEIVEVDEEQGPARSVPAGALLEDPLLPLKVQLAAMRSEK
jgi:hypothetical protein